MGTAIKHPVSDQVTERQSARMSKITNDGLTGILYSCIHMASAGVEGLNILKH